MKCLLMLSVWIASFWIATDMLADSPAKASEVQVRRKAVPASIAQMSSAELIDRLQDEAGEKIDLGKGSSAVRFAALDSELVFMPVDAPFHSGIRDPKRSPPSPVMTELVARGTESLSLLLAHLSDARPTRCAQVVQFAMGGPAGFADQYDSRYREKDQQPKEVNQVRIETLRRFSTSTYVLRVGDLCFYAVGQIVNRRLNPIGGGLAYASGGYHNRSMGINSPVEMPGLSHATRAEWSGLTPAEHEASLLADAIEESRPDKRIREVQRALTRLLFYYPSTGAEESERRLALELAKTNLSEQMELVFRLDAFDWPGLSASLHRMLKRAIVLKPDNVAQRFGRDQLILVIAQRLGRLEVDQDDRLFLVDEIAWWEGWQKETAAAPWFGTGANGLTNLWPHTKRWCSDASVVVAAKGP